MEGLYASCFFRLGAVVLNNKPRAGRERGLNARQPLLASVVVSGLPGLVALEALDAPPLVFAGDAWRERPAFFFGPRRSLVEPFSWSVSFPDPRKSQ